MSSTDFLRLKLQHLPERPGVYLMRDAEGAVLYVGKAKSLRSRVRSYFNSGRHDSLKTRELVRRIDDFETIVVGSEAEALILENNLIKENRPRFNINLRDDKTYPYIKVTVQEPFPRVIVTRRLQRDGARYFGPYTDVRRMRHAVAVVKRLHTVRSCHYRLPAEAPARPCLDYHIGRCKAPCVALQSEADYRGMIEEILEVLGGHTRRAAARLQEQMHQAAEEMRFERAAELRDAIRQLEALQARQQVVDVEGTDRDVVAFARDGAEACGVVLRIREGKLLGREAVIVSNLHDDPDEAVLGSVVGRVYLSREHDDAGLPAEIYLSADFADRGLVEQILSERAGGRVQLRVPQRGGKARLVELAEQNARHLLEERRMLSDTATGRAPDALFELQEALELETVPRRIVCFDVSHTQGSETVASAVAFENGKPHKAGYRRFRIKGEWGNDDYRSMHEAVTRYLRRRLDESCGLPDLVVIDGGKGQLGAARAALEALDCGHLPLVALAKRDEEVFVPDRAAPLRLPRRSAALQLLQRLRDEAHRFAVTYNRKLRHERTIRSELSSIPGIGAARQRLLLERFGSLRAVAGADEAQIAALPGFGTGLARTVLDHARRLAVAGAAQPKGDDQR
jgi:excinuclease ABC subunit C